MKGRPRKEKVKKEAASTLEEEQKNQRPKSSDSPIKELNEEVIKNLPVIRDLDLKVAALGEALSGSFNQVTVKFQEYDNQVKNTDEKITALRQAVSILNDEFSRFMETFQKLAASSSGSNTPPGTSVISSERVPLEKPAPAPVPAEDTPPSTGDKLLQWANLLAGLAGSGQPSSGGGGVNATDLLKLVLQLQDNAEERALKRTESSIKNIAAIANLLIGKKVEVPMEAAKPEIKEHL